MVDTTNFNIVPNDDEEQFTVEFGEIMNTGVIDFNELIHRPKYNNSVMTGETSIPVVPSQISELENNLNYQTEREVDAKIALEANARQQVDGQLQTTVGSLSHDLEIETAARQGADNNLQSQIDGISASSDVKDLVGTYAELQAYDTSTLGNNDIIKVLQDEMHSDETTYYRWSTTTQTFTLIGEEGPYYTKSATDQLLATKADKTTTYTKTEMDNLLSGKQGTLTAGDNISISGNTISATGTTYTAGNAIQIDTEENNRISADIYPADFFTATDEVFGNGTTITLNNTIALELDSVEICGDINQNGTPTPDTPVNINVVTGEQMITVSDGESQSQSYTVDLGSIELCKIGDYQDYIYKGTDGWYLHKEMKKAIFNGSENWEYNAEANKERVLVTVDDIALQEYIATAPVVTVCDQFKGSNWYNLYRGIAGVNVMSSHDSRHRITIRTNDFTSADSFKTWLSSHNMTVYYVLATPTDTKLTDSLLIDQLEALAKAQAYDGQTNIGVTASGTNLSAILSVNGYRKSLAGMTKAINYLMSKAE